MVALFAATIFVSSALLFLIEPMFARMALPLLGGAPSVWNTAMVFYQATLLAGYAYAHVTTRWLGVRGQVAMQIALLLLPLAMLPIGISSGWIPPTQSTPIPWLLKLMALTVGLPFFAIASMSPMIQRWFATTGHRWAADPYFLYAASNVGSMLALLSYPVWIEPHLRLAQQSRGWMWGYLLLVALTASCAVCLWKAVESSAAPPVNADPAISSSSSRVAVSESLPLRRRFRWVLLAAVPSSLMLGVTTYLSSEIAVVPLLWVIPLALYLLTFILVFARRQLFPRPLLARALSILLVGLVVALDMQATQPIGWLMLLHLAAFFVTAMLCHGALAADRPAASHLTEFYLWISVGGVLGGGFNALLAPLLFNSVTEYPLMLAVACIVALSPDDDRGTAAYRLSDLLWPALLAVFTIGLVLTLQATRFKTDAAMSGLVFGGPALLCYFFSRRPLRFALGIGALLFSGIFYQGEKGRVLHAERSFFGVHRVTLDPTGRYHLLVHGKTLHGMQSLDPARRHESLAYYYRSGPIGEVLSIYGRDPAKTIGVVGLGVGSLASFAQPGQPWTYYEIDPAVLKIARDEHFFTFLHDSPANLRVVLGDARLSLAAESNPKFDLLVLDAFSSDAIPVHLVTREALALYRQKLAPDGLLACHISNLHLDLEPVFANLAHDAGLVCLVRDDTDVSDTESALGKLPSIWLVMARSPNDLATLARDSRWRTARVDQRLAVWTDDYSSLLSVFLWR